MQASFQDIKKHVLLVLEQKLPSYLTYHSVEHTKYVLERTIYIASKEEIKKSDLLLLKVAALYHDIGFIESEKDHEERGCKIASKELKNFGFSEDEINCVCGMIMATKIPQHPKTHLEEILADADLEYLGTKYFPTVSELLYQERKHFNPDLTRKEWNKIQIEFMQKHHFYTKFCKQYKTHRKIKNIERLM